MAFYDCVRTLYNINLLEINSNTHYDDYFESIYTGFILLQAYKKLSLFMTINLAKKIMTFF